MGALHFPAMLLFQDAASMANDVHWIMICEVVLTAIVVILLLGIAIAGLVIYSQVQKLIKAADAKAQPLIAQATPLVAKGKEIAGHVNEIVADLKPKIAAVTSDLQPKIAAVTSDLQPKIASVTSDVQHISSVVRGKVDEAGVTFTKVNQTVQQYTDTAQDVNHKAKDQVQRVDTLVKGQVERVNGMVSDALTTTQHVSKQIQHGIRVPVEKIASWVTAAKVGIENLAEKVPFLKHEQPGRPGGARPGGAATRPGPVPVPQPGARVVHSAEDEARTTGVPVRNTPPNG
jgi:methyl-accepting chemotaxis protein